MEIHRLTPMKPYDPRLFNELYKKTERLRKSLTYQIDARRVGVTHDEVLSWFDDKFIFVFNKYADVKEPNILLGFIINSLQVFKQKILRRSYQLNNSVNLNSISIEDLKVFNIVDQAEEDNKELLLNLAFSFMETRLSQEAYDLLQLQLNPPLFIQSKLKTKTSKIPPQLILGFLGLEITPKNLDVIAILKDEINMAIQEAKTHFKDFQLA